MKKVLSMTLLLTAMLFTFSSCSDDDDSKFDYPMEDLYGEWDVVAIEVNGKWCFTNMPQYKKFAMSISFNSDGTFYGSGYLGYGSGTYTTAGNTIITYLKGKEYIRYVVKSLRSNTAALTMVQGDTSLDIHAVKKSD